MYNLRNIDRYSYAVFDQVLDIQDLDLLDNITQTQDAVLAGDRSDKSVRKAKINWINDYAKFNQIYAKVVDVVNKANKEFFNYDIDWIEPLQYTVYESPGEFYGKHIDYGQTPGCRKLSFSIQLSQPTDYQGGELLLYNGGTVFTADKKIGSLTIFNSMILHEVTPVTTGIRKSLVGWAIGPEWR